MVSTNVVGKGNMFNMNLAIDFSTLFVAMPENSIDLDFHIGWFIYFVPSLLTSSTRCRFCRTWIARTSWSPVAMSLAVAFITRFVALLGCLHCRYDLIPCIIAFAARKKRILFEMLASLFPLFCVCANGFIDAEGRNTVWLLIVHTRQRQIKSEYWFLFCFVHLIIVAVPPRCWRYFISCSRLISRSFYLFRIVIFLWSLGSRDMIQQFSSWKRQYFLGISSSK